MNSTDLAQVEWRRIPSLPGYEASSDGQVRHTESGGIIHQYRAGKIDPYCCMKLKNRRYLVHRLIAEAFHGAPGVCPLVNHKNGIKWDNHAANLEWATHSDNVQHAYNTGLSDSTRSASSAAMKLAHAEGRVHYSRGSRHYLSKLDDQKVREVKELITTGESDSSIAKKYGVARATIRQIRQGKTWKHI